MKTMKTTSVRFDERTQTRLEEAARLEGRRPSDLIRDAVNDYVSRLFSRHPDHAERNRADRMMAPYLEAAAGLPVYEGPNEFDASDEFGRLLMEEYEQEQHRARERALGGRASGSAGDAAAPKTIEALGPELSGRAGS